MKSTKASVGFEHPAQGPDHCSQCQHFDPNSHTCELVEGRILPRDWCRLWTKKMATNLLR